MSHLRWIKPKSAQFRAKRAPQTLYRLGPIVRSSPKFRDDAAQASTVVSDDLARLFRALLLRQKNPSRREIAIDELKF